MAAYRSTSLAFSFVIGLVACAAHQPPPNPYVTLTSAEIVRAVPESPRASPPAPEPDHHAAAVADANRVLAEMHDDLIACYAARLAKNPRAHGAIVLDILIGPDGRVMTIDTTGGALIGERAMRCIVDRVELGTFAPVRGGGTLRVEAPFTLSVVAADELPAR